MTKHTRARVHQICSEFTYAWPEDVGKALGIRSRKSRYPWSHARAREAAADPSTREEEEDQNKGDELDYEPAEEGGEDDEEGDEVPDDREGNLTLNGDGKDPDSENIHSSNNSMYVNQSN